MRQARLDLRPDLCRRYTPVIFLDEAAKGSKRAADRAVGAIEGGSPTGLRCCLPTQYLDEARPSLARPDSVIEQGG